MTSGADFTTNLPKAESTKTDKERVVAISPELYDHLHDMEIQAYPQDFYLFGSFRSRADRYAKHDKGYLPAPCRIPRSHPTRLWKQYVKDGLGIDVKLYSNKHAGANRMRKLGISRDAIKRNFGHGSMDITDIYITEEILLDEIKRSDLRFED